MDIQKILVDLRQQRDQVAAVIEALERISHQQTPRRGRPPKWLIANRINASRNGGNGSLNGSLSLARTRNAGDNSTLAAANGGSGD